ncbi:MAG: PD-(D/E)XK nuclease family protein [Candidatus Portnoybacteria bacterium]|nr:PD-(D/E)XK nuclease family protein [Candidatus Portnoybacteria bacterium]
MRISYSGLDTFSTCPAQYKFQYIDRIKVPKSKEAVFGTLIHDCLKMFHEPSKPTPLSEDDLLKYFTERWDSSIYEDSQEEAFAFHQGIDLLKKYYLQNQGVEFNIINLETLFGVPILEGKKFHQITGRIDRIDKLSDGTFEVIDYKTTKKMPSQADVDKNFQLSVYYLGITNRWPSLQEENRPVKLSLYYLRHGEKLSAFRNSQEIKETQERILDLIRQIKKSNFEPRSNPLCNWCQYKPYCPLFKHKFVEQESPTPDEQQIKEVIKEYFEIKDKQGQDNKRLMELKEILNQYCDKNGLDRVFGENGYITRLPQQRFTYNFNKVKQVLEPIGKWHQILTIDKTKFKKVVDSLPYELKKQIDQAKTLEREFKVISVTKKDVP